MSDEPTGADATTTRPTEPVTVRSDAADGPTLKRSSPLLALCAVGLLYFVMVCMFAALDDPVSAYQVLWWAGGLTAAASAWHALTSGRYTATWQGLVVERPGRRPRLITHAEIADVSVRSGRVQIALKSGRAIRFPAGRTELALADRLDADLWRAQHGAERQLVAEDRLVALLGLSSQEIVTCTPAPWAQQLASALSIVGWTLGAVLCGGLASLLSPWLWLTALLLSSTAVYGAMLAWLDGAGMELSADQQGLHLPYGRSGSLCPWSQVRHVAQLTPRPRLFGGHQRWRLTLTTGNVPLCSLHTHVERLVALCERAVQLRQEGHDWPAVVEIPEGALSRATGDTSDADRGISLAGRTGVQQ